MRCIKKGKVVSLFNSSAIVTNAFKLFGGKITAFYGIYL